MSTLTPHNFTCSPSFSLFSILSLPQTLSTTRRGWPEEAEEHRDVEDLTWEKNQRSSHFDLEWKISVMFQILKNYSASDFSTLKSFKYLKLDNRLRHRGWWRRKGLKQSLYNQFLKVTFGISMILFKDSFSCTSCWRLQNSPLRKWYKTPSSARRNVSGEL